MDDTASDIEQRKTNRLHPLADPSVPKPQLFERSMQVQGHHHDAPPSGIGAELATGQSAASKVILHDRMDFLALATAQTMPSDQIIASHFELIGDNAEQFVGARQKLHGWKRQLWLLLDTGQALLRKQLSDSHESVGRTLLLDCYPIGDKADLGPLLLGGSAVVANQRSPIVVFDLTGGVLECLGDITTDGKWDDAKTLVLSLGTVS